MNGLDVALLALVAGPSAIGVLKGLTNVAAVCVGTWAALLLAPLAKALLAPPLARAFGSDELAAVLAYGAGFFATVILFGVLGWLLTRSLKKLDLQWANRAGGALVGAVSGALLGGLLVAAIGTVEPGAAVLERSVLAGPLSAVTNRLLAIEPSATGSGDERRDESGTPADAGG